MRSIVKHNKKPKKPKDMLKRYSILTSTLVAANFLTLPVFAEESNFNQVYIFGNSLSDRGNIYSLTGNTFPPEPFYDDGRFSNGSIWVDSLKEKIGLNPGNFYEGESADLSEGINFSIGGATTGTTALGDIPEASIFFPGVETQIDDFLAFVGDGAIDEDALVIYWAGENDYSQALQSPGADPETVINNTISNIATSLSELAGAGAENIVVANLKDLGSVPLGQSLADPALLNQLTQAHNNALDTAISSLEASFTDTNFVTFDVNGLLRDIANNPESFDLDLVDDPSAMCWDNNFPNIDPNAVLCNNPEQYIYYDNQHFTSTIQEIIAEDIINTIDQNLGSNPNTIIPEGGNTIGIIGLGLGLLTVAKRKNYNRYK